MFRKHMAIYKNEKQKNNSSTGKVRFTVFFFVRPPSPSGAAAMSGTSGELLRVQTFKNRS